MAIARARAAATATKLMAEEAPEFWEGAGVDAGGEAMEGVGAAEVVGV